MHVKDLASIKIEGRCFSTPAVLNLFQGKNQRLSFVFGKNGSGKSTISTAVKEASKGSPPEGIICMNYLDANNAVLADELDVLQSTFVFNESFVEQNVRISEDGLHAIVMIGETGDLTEKINLITKDLQTTRDDLDEAQRALLSMSDSSSPLSIQFHKNQIHKTLTALGGWGDREKEIRSLKRAASVTDSVQSAISQLPLPDEPKEQLEDEYRKAILDLNRLSEGEELPGVPPLPDWLFEIDEDQIATELGRIIEHPDLTDRDRRILSLAEREGMGTLTKSRNYFKIDGNDMCPFCFRNINEEEKTGLFDSVSALLNEAANKHAKDLSDLHIPAFAIDLSGFVELSREDVEAANSLVKEIQEKLAFLNCQIEAKIQNLYSPVHIENLQLEKAISELSAILSSISAARIAWNESTRNKQHFVDNLQALNKKIARCEIHSCIAEIEKAKSNKTRQDELVRSLNEKVDDLSTERNDLENQKSNINIALDAINESLAFIFLSNDRLVLSGEHGEYALYSRGEKVRPCDVSAGERNAIALCYFFTLIGAGKSAGEEYSDSMFVLIDDPISSLDQDNRIGILSYIRHQLIKIVTGNRYSKAVVFTHDGYCMNAFEKMRKEIVNRSASAGSGFKIPYPALMELSNCSLGEWKLDAMRYTELIGLMYDYSISPNDQQRPIIGNVARKALEAFSTFEFSMGLSEFVDSDEALSAISDKKLKSYFSRLMFSIVLHGESHTADPVKIEGIVETTREYSSSEIDRIVRDSLLLLYCLNQNHVLTHLKDRDDVQSQLDSWVDELKSI
ncbi:AAA family ATPase [Slackia exigua]|uniref:AAA family ATPase n=1 Tax=Slackia exigua TaxID=84109 RepID=UPI00254A2729|nr:AAA family ATPase [Slackia exigua]MDK7723890.1 AAA family ATPase [Slackia exigua]MDK7725121.1 AAA family ATPase [Slackia exigua]